MKAIFHIKSRSNPFLNPTSTEQRAVCSLKQRGPWYDSNATDYD